MLNYAELLHAVLGCPQSSVKVGFLANMCLKKLLFLIIVIQSIPQIGVYLTSALQELDQH